MKHVTPTVSDYLVRSQSARAASQMSFGRGRKLTVWCNQFGEVSYEDTSGHAFSLYLRGANNVRRLDGNGEVGIANSICVFPEGHSSDWQIGRGTSFMHLYVPDAELRAQYARVHDKDARSLFVDEIIMKPAANLQPAMRKLAAALSDQDFMLADEGYAELVGSLTSTNNNVTSGLAPHLLRRVDEYLNVHLDEQIRLKDLSALCDMSEFHFQRMYAKSRGLSPQKWIEKERIERAKSMLAVMPAAHVSVQCGFANQSHFTRVFKKMTGLTPAAYKRQTQN